MSPLPPTLRAQLVEMLAQMLVADLERRQAADDVRRDHEPAERTA
jgi:hypothetical protein